MEIQHSMPLGEVLSHQALVIDNKTIVDAGSDGDFAEP